MLPNVGWAEILVLLVVGLVVLGPERLPEAARWLAGAIRKVKDYAKTAEQQLKDDFGADFDEFREPLQQINQLRGMTPRALVTKHLLDGDESLLGGEDFLGGKQGPLSVGGSPAPDVPGQNPQGQNPGGASGAGSSGNGHQGRSAPAGYGQAQPPRTAPPAGGGQGSSGGAPGGGAVWDTDAT